MRLLEMAKTIFSPILKYSDEILKVFGASAVITLVIKIIKDIIKESNEKNDELEALLSEMENGNEESKKQAADKALQFIKDNPLFKRKYDLALMELAEKRLEVSRELTKNAVYAHYMWFEPAKDVKFDAKALENIRVSLFGVPDENGNLVRINPDNISNAATSEAIGTIQEYISRYTSIDSDTFKLIDNKIYDSDDDLYEDREDGVYIGEAGIYINFTEEARERKITDEDRELFDKVLYALNVALAENPDLPEEKIKGKYFVEYFIVDDEEE